MHNKISVIKLILLVIIEFSVIIYTAFYFYLVFLLMKILLKKTIETVNNDKLCLK